MRVKETFVFQFDELTEHAKEKARDCYRECANQDFSDFHAETVLDDANTICNTLGVTIATHTVKLMGGGSRQKPTIYYSGFSSQGDGACFEGSYSYRKGAVKAIKEYAPQDEVLARIATELQDVQRRNFYRLQASITHHGRYFDTTIEVEDSNDTYRDLHGDEETVADCLRDIMHWIYRSLEKEYEYQNSSEVIDENIRANEYEFDEEGRRS